MSSPPHTTRLTTQQQQKQQKLCCREIIVCCEISIRLAPKFPPSHWTAKARGLANTNPTGEDQGSASFYWPAERHNLAQTSSQSSRGVGSIVQVVALSMPTVQHGHESCNVKRRVHVRNMCRGVMKNRTPYCQPRSVPCTKGQSQKRPSYFSNY